MKTQRWIDLSARGIYLGSIRMADGAERLALLDMDNTAAPERLREIGFLPFEGSPRYESGIYYLSGEQALRPSRIAAALGIEKCPLVDVSAEEVERVFRERCFEKFQANLNAATLRAEVLGQNKDGHYVYDTPAGRFVRTGKATAVLERSAEGQALGRATFLRAGNDAELRDCAAGYVHRVLAGARTTWTDVTKFAQTVHGRGANEEELHRLQEALEASAYQAFSARAQSADERAFRLAVDLYYGLPGARMRTAESVFLQQYSTPLPMAVAAQRLLMGADDLQGATVLEPTAGNGGLVSLLAGRAQVHAIELDRKRLQALQAMGGVRAELGDALETPFRARFGLPEGFDYTIANPPFGGMDEPRAFDKLAAVRRQDHYIALRTLQARKDQGRSVLIFGADSAQSDGTVKGGARAFLNYVHDHYEVHGCVELDGRMYVRHGAGYNVRLLVVGDKLARPREQEVPDKLAVLTDYDQLWAWADKVAEAYPKRSAAARAEVKPEPEIGDSVFVRSGPAKGSIRTLLAKVPLGYEVSDSLSGKITVARVEFHRKLLVSDAKVGDWIRFTPHDLGNPLAGAVVEGLVVDVATTSGGNFRYRVRTAEAAPQGGGNVERLVYSQAGTVELLGPEAAAEAKDSAPPEALVADVAALGAEAEPSFRTQDDRPAVAAPSDPLAVARDKQPYELTHAEWLAALAALESAPPRGRFPGNAEAVRIGERERLLYGVTQWFHERAKAGDEQAREWVLDGTNRPSHRDVVVKAISEQKVVPANVLAEYPELAAPAPERRSNEYQVPYQPASHAPMGAAAMIPINMAGATYAALNDLEARVGPVDEFVARKLQYKLDDIVGGTYFDAAQIDGIALGIDAIDHGRGVINADQTGFGKGRFVAAMMRYAKLQEKTPVFLTIKPELFTDIFRDIEDIGSRHLFNRLFVFNEGVHVMRFGTEDEVLYRATPPQERRQALDDMEIDKSIDMVLATYSQFQRAATKNRKAQLLTAISQQETMLFLDEAHVASGASNIAAAVGEAVANAKGVIYSSATPLKGISNFSIYNKVFPASVDLMVLPDTLRAGGEALQEAISANMARDGVLIRREHDLSKLTFRTRLPTPEREQRNVVLADKLARVLSAMSYLSGDVRRMVNSLNKRYEEDWSKIPEKERSGGRMRASSMNFGSRLYALNRQFLLGIKIDECVETALEALQEGRKPVIAVENTGESLLRQVLSRRAGVDGMEAELEELEEKAGTLTDDEKRRRDELQDAIAHSLRTVKLDEPPQYRELLEIMLDRLAQIKVQGRYGDVSTVKPNSEEYAEAEKHLREMIHDFPDMPLTPLDVLRHELGRRGFPITEVSGRTASLEVVAGGWRAQFHQKADAVANVAGFQNGKYDAIIITRSGSTGISLHATDRFDDSDTRQRDFIVLQKAANIAEFLQWLGRVNRKDQVCEPLITQNDSGLPAELRLTMMHNAKLRKLSANTTSNRDNSAVEGDDLDLLNEVGDKVALDWLVENPDIADYLDIDLPKDEEEVVFSSHDCPYINKLLGRLMMVEVEKQREILRAITRRFMDRIEELEQRGENPFTVQVFEWGARAVKEEELQGGVLRPTGSTFDEAVKIVTLEFEQDVRPIRSKRLLEMIASGNESFQLGAPVDKEGSLSGFIDKLRKLSEEALRRQLPGKLRDLDQSVAQIMAANELPSVVNAKAKQDFLLENLYYFKPGAFITHNDLFKGEVKGIVTSVEFPNHREELFLLSKYRMRVVFPGDDAPKDLSLATVFNEGQSLAASAYRAIDLEKIQRLSFARDQAQVVLKPYDEAPDGRVKRRAHVLQGNIFRACELAHQQRMGSPILYSDADGNRQRAVLLKERVTPEKVKALPIGLDAQDMAAYITEFLRPDHRDHRSRSMYGGLRIHDHAVKDMRPGDGVMLEVLNGGQSFRLTIPGSKARAGGLMTDGTIFDIGEKTAPGSLRLKLSGQRAFMKADVSRDVLPELMLRLQAGRHVGKFYLPEPDHEVLKALKVRYEEECREGLSKNTQSALAL